MSRKDYIRNTNPYYKVLQDLDTITIVETEDEMNAMLNNFSKVGLDYRGCSQYCYRADGESSKLAISMDPLRVKTGFFSSKVTGALEGSIEKKSFMILQRGVSQELSETPVSLHSLVGSRWSGSCEASIFLGIVVKADMINLSSPISSERSNGNDTAISELISMSMVPAITAGATISGSASCDVFYAEDKYPQYYNLSIADTEKLKGTIKALIEEGTLKSLVKKEAVEFIRTYNSSSNIRFKQKNYIYERRTPISNIKRELIELGNNIAFGMSTTESIEKRKQLDRHLFLLDLWDNGSNLPIVPTFLRVTGYSAEGSGRLSIDADILKQKIGVKAECSGSYIPTSTTFQSVYPINSSSTGFVCTTQTTNINYEEVRYSCEGEAKTKVGKKKVELIETATIRTISYLSSTIVWKHIPTPRNKLNKQQESGNIDLPNVSMERGSGISVGKTFDIDNILKFYQKDDDGNFIAPGIDPIFDLKEQASRTVQVYNEVNENRSIGSRIGQFIGVKSKNSLPGLEVIEEMISKNAGREDLRAVYEWLLGLREDKPVLPQDIKSTLREKLSINSQFRQIVRRYYDNFLRAEQESMDLYDAESYTPTEYTYLLTVANSLCITFDQLRDFLLSPGVFETLRDLQPPQSLNRSATNNGTIQGGEAADSGIKTIILEASFRPVMLGSIECRKRVSLTRTTVEIQELSIRSKLRQFIEVPKAHELESIAIRYYQQDKKDDGKSFSPGISILGTGAGLKLKKIEESGSAAVVEILRVWFHPQLAGVASRDPAGAYESAVPPVALFLR